MVVLFVVLTLVCSLLLWRHFTCDCYAVRRRVLHAYVEALTQAAHTTAQHNEHTKSRARHTQPVQPGQPEQLVQPGQAEQPGQIAQLSQLAQHGQLALPEQLAQPEQSFDAAQERGQEGAQREAELGIQEGREDQSVRSLLSVQSMQSLQFWQLLQFARSIQSRRSVESDVLQPVDSSAHASSPQSPTAYAFSIQGDCTDAHMGNEVGVGEHVGPAVGADIGVAIGEGRDANIGAEKRRVGESNAWQLYRDGLYDPPVEYCMRHGYVSIYFRGGIGNQMYAIM